MSDSRAAAVALATRGFRVFRLNAQTLRPAAAGFTESASSDPEKVYEEFSDALGEPHEDQPGILTGDNLAVLDFDVKPDKITGKPRPGLLSLAELLAEGLPDDTLTVRTATGGLHKYYRVDNALEFRNRVGWLEGVDVRGYHGYVVAPGAERVGIGPYTIVRDMAPAALPVAFQEQLSRVKRERTPTEVTDKYEDDWSISESIKILESVEAIDGQKHADVIAAMHRCFDLGVTPDTLENLIPEYIDWFADLWTQDLQAEMGSVVQGRIRDGKAWGVDNPRSRPSIYAVFDKVSLADPSHEGPRNAKPTDYECFSLAELEGEAPAPRAWLIPDLIPDRTVTLLSGDGGVGKSLVALQLSIAVATSGQWLGMAPTPGGVVYVSAEDERNEIHRRALDIAKVEGIEWRDLTNVHIVDLAGKDAVLGQLDANGGIKPAKRWADLLRTVERVKPKLVVLDTSADVYAGNENVREQVRQFVGQLRGLALRYDCAVLLLSHPSLTGMGSGSGSSGSTAWNNSVRSRLYLTRPEDEAERKRDPDLRVLRTMKLNYAAGVGDERPLRWAEGRFVCGGSRVTVEADGEAAFLSQLAKFEKQGRDVSHGSGWRYAPKLFNEDMPSISKKAFAVAMTKLLEDGLIAIETTGPKSRPIQKLITKK